MPSLLPYFGQILSQHHRMHCVDLSEKIVGELEKLMYKNKLIHSDK